MTDVVPPDYSSNVGLCRLLIPDTSNVEYILSDEQITALLALFNSSVKRAAAQAKDIIAADTTMLLKVIKTDDLQIDGVKVAAELRAQASVLRAEANLEEVGGYFFLDYPADPVIDPLARTEWLWF